MRITTETNKHNMQLSIAKAVCIILMVIGHSGCPQYLHDWIYLFHMPCFFLISGYLLSDSKISENISIGIKKRFKSLWWPYVKWSLFFLLCHNAFYRIGICANAYTVYDMVVNAWKTLFFYGSEQLLYPFWFLSASLVSSILAMLYLKMWRMKKSTYIIFGGMSFLFVASIVDYLPIKVPLFGSVQLLAASFYLMGYYIKHTNLLNNNPVIIMLLSLSLFVVPFAFTADITVKGWSSLIYFCMGMMGSIGVLTVSSYLAKTKLAKLLDYIGSHTLYILTFHFLAFKAISYK